MRLLRKTSPTRQFMYPSLFEGYALAGFMLFQACGGLNDFAGKKRQYDIMRCDILT
jgi:hypothetical protein